jgi:hypothetical protein
MGKLHSTCTAPRRGGDAQLLALRVRQALGALPLRARLLHLGVAVQVAFEKQSLRNQDITFSSYFRIKD